MKLITSAKEKYLSSLGQKLSDINQGKKSYWYILYGLINEKCAVNIPPLLENGLFVTNIQRKATILNDYFLDQCSTIVTGSTLPNFRPQSTWSPTEIHIDKEKILRLIRSLDSNKAHGCDNISVSMIKIFDDCLVELLSLIFKK